MAVDKIDKLAELEETKEIEEKIDSELRIQSKNEEFNLYKYFIYFVIYSSFAITLIFTVGGVLFSIPPLCDVLGIGLLGKYIIGAISTIGAFWGTYVVQGICLRDLILKVANLPDEIPKKTQADNERSEPSLLRKILVITMLVGNAIFFIAGGYFGMLSILAYAGLEANSLAAIASLILATINYLPTFALNGLGLYKSAIGYPMEDEIKLEVSDVATQTDCLVYDLQPTQNLESDCVVTEIEDSLPLETSDRRAFSHR